MRREEEGFLKNLKGGRIRGQRKERIEKKKSE